MIKPNIGIIDYGVGNLRNLVNAFKQLEINVKIVNCKENYKNLNAIVLPGVGAFPYAMDVLQQYDAINLLKEFSKTKPILGICLGMQLLFTKSFELGLTNGLNFLPGNVVNLKNFNKSTNKLKVPSIGWHKLEFIQNSSLLNNQNSYFYFAHSYALDKDSVDQKVITSFYNLNSFQVIATVQHNYIYGTQFHPEKSGISGIELLKNFINII